MTGSYIPLAEQRIPPGGTYLESILLQSSLCVDFHVSPRVALEEYLLFAQEIFAVNEGEIVGRITLQKAQALGDEPGWHVGYIEAGIRNVGLGAALYLGAARSLFSVSSSEFMYSYGSRQPEAIRCWERLCLAGLATRTQMRRDLPTYEMPALAIPILEASRLATQVVPPSTRVARRTL